MEGEIVPGKLAWIDGAVRPDCPDYYFRKSGASAQDCAYWDGNTWFHVNKSKDRGLRVMESPHKDQMRLWRAGFIKAVNTVAPGDKFSMLTYVKDFGADKINHRWLAIFRCDCGSEKAMNLYEVTNGRHRSCGCLKNSQERIEKHKVSHRKWLDRNMHKVIATNISLGKSRAGSRREMGPGAAWEFNVNAKHWHLVHENGLVLKGWNLSNLIRENVSYFDASDVLWFRGECKAKKRLSDLHCKKKDGSPVRTSWKGWRSASNIIIET